ncbi:MAG: ornithine--oxo-acid transaminase [Clostridia bacterium]
MTKSTNIIELTEKYGANNYKPLPIVISKAEGVWVEDPEGKKYMDFLSAYSAVNQGHRHPKIMKAMIDQLDRVTLTSRAFHNDKLGDFYKIVSDITQKDLVLPMNTGVEAVETAVKAARRWGYFVKGIEEDKAEIIVCENNFHGRTILAVSLSSSEKYKRGYGPMLAGIKIIPYGDVKALKEAINENTAAFLFEPIQGEAGINIPPKGYLKQVSEICKEENVLTLADEIQTGLGRTGKMFACDWEGVKPDIYILGKAISGGAMPVSCVAANKEVLDVFEPGSHGSTFGGNPLACAVAIAALEVIVENDLPKRSLELGEYFLAELKKIDNPSIKEIRGKGLFIGIELTSRARPYCETLKELGLLCKETHDTVIRLAPPLIIKKDEIDWALDKLRKVL